MVSALDISTPGGQQILYDLVNWRISGHKPLAPHGNVDFYNSRPNVFHVVAQPTFRTAAQLIAPVAVGKMSEDDFHCLVCILSEPKHEKLVKELCETRAANPCDGSPINPPFPFACGLKSREPGAIDKLNRYTKTGRRLLMDLVDHERTGFHPTEEVGNVRHWRSRKEFQVATQDAFRSQALKMAKDVRHYMPNKKEMEKIIKEALQEGQLIEDSGSTSKC